MAARKKAAARKPRAARTEETSKRVSKHIAGTSHNLDLSDVSVKQVAALLAALMTILVVLSGGFGWFFNAERAHELTHEHDVVIDEYTTIWDESRQKRKAEIAEAEAFYRENRSQ